MNDANLPPDYSDWMTDPAPTEEEFFECEQRTQDYVDRLIDEQKEGQCFFEEKQERTSYLDDLPLSKVDRTMADFFISLTIPKK